jgi:hypothetical protein
MICRRTPVPLQQPVGSPFPLPYLVKSKSRIIPSPQRRSRESRISVKLDHAVVKQSPHWQSSRWISCLLCVSVGLDHGMITECESAWSALVVVKRWSSNSTECAVARRTGPRLAGRLRASCGGVDFRTLYFFCTCSASWLQYWFKVLNWPP